MQSSERDISCTISQCETNQQEAERITIIITYYSFIYPR